MKTVLKHSSLLILAILVSSTPSVLAYDGYGVAGKLGCLMGGKGLINNKANFKNSGKGRIYTDRESTASSVFRIQGDVNAQVTIGLSPIYQSGQEEIGLTGIEVKSGRFSTYTNNDGRFSLPTEHYKGVVSTIYKSTHLEIRKTTYAGLAPANPAPSRRCGEFMRIWGMPIYFCWDYLISQLPWSNNRSVFNSLKLGDSSVENVAQANVHTHVKESENFIKDTIGKYWKPEKVVAWTENGISACGAFYSPENKYIIFGPQVGTCANGAYSTIIRHEYGHSFVQSLGINWNIALDFFGFHEGVADTLAAMSLKTRCIALNFLAPQDGCLRDLNVHFNYPVTGQPSHTRGRPLSGAFLDLMDTLIDRHGKAIGYKRAKDIFLWTMRLNTDGLTSKIKTDALLINATLGFQDGDLIRTAFESHGF